MNEKLKYKEGAKIKVRYKGRGKIKVSHPEGGCFLCSKGFYAFFDEEKEIAYFDFIFKEDSQGPPGYAHGGAIAIMIDEVMSFATTKMFPCLLAEIEIKYKKSVPLYKKVNFEGRVVGSEGRKFFTEAVIKLDGEILVEAKGIYIRPKNFGEVTMRKLQ